MPKKEEKLVRGSIRVTQDDHFYEEREVQQVDIRFGELSAILHTVSIPKDLQTIFEAARIQWDPNTHNGRRIRTEISGITFDEIVKADEGFLRLRFSGLTEAALQAKLWECIKWIETHNISYGEKDGKVACIFKCLTSEQLEVGSF